MLSEVLQIAPSAFAGAVLWTQPSDRMPLRLANLRLVRDGGLTKAAVMLFGEYPEDVATSAQIHIIHFKGVFTLDDRLIAGNLW